MNQNDTVRLISIIKSQYQHKFITDAMTAITWNDLLNQEPAVPFEEARKAALLWMRDNDWPPSVKDLRDIIASTVVGIPDADAAWNHLSAWLKAGYPGMPDRRPKLPALIAEALSDVGGTHAVRASEKPDEMRKRFCRAYDQRRRAQMAVTPLERGDGATVDQIGPGRDRRAIDKGVA